MIKKVIFGAKDGLPIALGYLAVSFSFGMTASSAGVPIWVAVALSALNLTSAGQFSALTLMCSYAPLTEICAATFIINLRYLLMSIVLSQRLVPMNLAKRMLVGFGVTDEIFTVASTKPQKVGFWYMTGLIAVPYIGWTLGTFLGAVAGSLLDEAMRSALGIGLYAMFIAIVVPAAFCERSVLFAVAVATAVSSAIYFVPVLSVLSGGWSVIISSVIAAAITALLFPQTDRKIKEGE